MPPLISPAKIDQAVAWAQDAGLNTLFVQIRASGDAYYATDLIPRADGGTTIISPAAG